MSENPENPAGHKKHEWDQKIDELLEADHRLDRDSREEIRAYLAKISDATEYGAPVLLVDYPLDGSFEVQHAGLLSSPEIDLRQDYGNDAWWLKAETHTTNQPRGSLAKMPYSLRALSGDIASGREPRLFVGKEAVMGWIKRYKFASTHTDNPPRGLLSADLRLLANFQDFGFPLEDLDFTKMQREKIADYCAEYMLGNNDYNLEADKLCGLLSFVAGANTPDQVKSLFEPFAYELAMLLPTGDFSREEHRGLLDAIPAVAGKAIDLEKRFSRTTPLSGPALLPAALHYLYEIKAATLPSTPIKLPDPGNWEPQEWPATYTPAVFRGSFPADSEIWRDVAYFNRLRRSASGRFKPGLQEARYFNR